METADVPGSLGRTLVYRSAGRSLLLILGGLVLIAGAALMVVGAVPALPHPAAVLYLLIGGAGLLLFVPGVGRLVWQLAQRRPVLEIGPDGILDRRLSREVMPWSAVRRIDRTRVQRQEFVTLDLVPGAGEGYLTGHTNRLMHRVNQRAGFRGMHLSVVGLRCTADELYEAVCRHRR
jgi:hypothetical protein